MQIFQKRHILSDLESLASTSAHVVYRKVKTRMLTPENNLQVLHER